MDPLGLSVLITKIIYSRFMDEDEVDLWGERMYEVVEDVSGFLVN